MIKRLSHASIYVLDQDSALDFYTNKLGFEVRMDQQMDNGFRWLTVGPKTQPDVEFILMATSPSFFLSEENSKKLRELIQAGVLGAGVWLTDDCWATYEELKAKGVKFIKEPSEEFYGVEAVFADDSGNWYSLTQRKG